MSNFMRKENALFYCLMERKNLKVNLQNSAMFKIFVDYELLSFDYKISLANLYNWLPKK